MKKTLVSLFAGLLMFGLINVAEAANVISTFDNDLEGWYSINDPGSTSHVYEGLNGMMKVEDLSNNPQTGHTLYLIAPPKFLGDWMNYETLSMDMNAKGWNDDSLFVGKVRFEMSDTINKARYIFDDTQIIGDEWINYSLTLDPTLDPNNWYISGDWYSLKNNVSSLNIVVDLVVNQKLTSGPNIYDINYVDNIKLTQSPAPVPEPSSMILGLISIAGYLGSRKNKRKS